MLNLRFLPHRPICKRLTTRVLILTVVVCQGSLSADDGTSASPAVPSGRRNVPTVLSDQQFSSQPGKAGLCDVYSPSSQAPPGGHPVVIVVHGGGWLSGDKWVVEGYSRLLARNGFVAISINYRLAPKYKFPAQVDDVREALLWAKKNKERLHVDIDRLGMFGYSAGGHLSALVASLADEPIDVRVTASGWDETDPRWNQLPVIKAVCVGGPPCDFQTLPIDNTSLAYFLGGSRRDRPQVYAAASPLAHVTRADPVTQIIHGEGDLIVPIHDSRKFHNAQLAAGVDSRMEVIPKQGHLLTFINPKTSKKALEFFAEVLHESEKRKTSR